jgi:chemotaxis protein CheX
MKVEYINPFINATRKLMEIMLGIKHFEKKEVYLDQQTSAVYDVSAIIGVTGDCMGSIVLSFSKKVAAEMLSKLLGEPITEFDDDVHDAVCEMVNIIAGNACAELTTSGVGQINRALPQVIYGKGHSIKNPKNTPCINVIFDTELGPFAMQVSLKF